MEFDSYVGASGLQRAIAETSTHRVIMSELTEGTHKPHIFKVVFYSKSELNDDFIKEIDYTTIKEAMHAMTLFMHEVGDN